jgi:rubrerythrin
VAVEAVAKALVEAVLRSSSVKADHIKRAQKKKQNGHLIASLSLCKDAEAALTLGAGSLRKKNATGCDEQPQRIPAASSAVTRRELAALFPALRSALYGGEGDDGSVPSAETIKAPTTAIASQWQCAACTSFNPPVTAICLVCETPAPASGGSATATPQPWQCPVCTLINEAGRQACGACGTVDSNQASVKAKPGQRHAVSWCPEGYWVCSVEHGGCSKFNPNTAYYCDVCERGRPNLASVRF